MKNWLKQFSHYVCIWLGLYYLISSSLERFWSINVYTNNILAFIIIFIICIIADIMTRWFEMKSK
jgi:hypothetical protein